MELINQSILGNLLPACARCNAKKGDRPLDWCMSQLSQFSLSSEVALNPGLSVEPHVKLELLESLKLKRLVRSQRSSTTREQWVQQVDQFLREQNSALEESLREISAAWDLGPYISMKEELKV
eukprot:scaffold245226_cov41-Prasinocladus_malaysianus.AAC.2